MVGKNKSGQILIEMLLILFLFVALLNAFEKLNAVKSHKIEKYKISKKGSP